MPFLFPPFLVICFSADPAYSTSFSEKGVVNLPNTYLGKMLEMAIKILISKMNVFVQLIKRDQ